MINTPVIIMQMAMLSNSPSMLMQMGEFKLKHVEIDVMGFVQK